MKRAGRRVGVVTTSYPRWSGDYAGGFVAEHVEYLRGTGWEVEVIAAGDGDRETGIGDWNRRQATGDRRQATGDGVGRIGGRGVFYGGGAPEALERGKWGAAGLFTAEMMWEVARRARRWDAAVCHWLVPSALAVMVAAPRVPVLAVAHSGDVHLLRRTRLLGPFGVLAAARSVRLSFTTAGLRQMFLDGVPRAVRRRLERSSQVCPMGVDVERLQRERRERGDAPVVLFLGRLVPVKGAATAIDAAKLWRSRARLVVAGEGPERERLARLADAAPPDRVAFVGPLAGPERDRALASADLVVLPSLELPDGRTEGLPVTALEAMAAGAGLVASAVGGLAEIPDGAVTRVRPGDAIGLAAAIDDLLGDPRRLAVQRAAQERFVRDRDWSKAGARLLPPE